MKAFDSMAKTYIEKTFLVSRGTMYEDYIEKVIVMRELNQIKDQTLVLDLGVGSGRWLKRMIADNYRVVGVDISPLMIGQLHRSMQGYDTSLILSDIEYLPLKECTFDGAICIRVIKYIPNTIRALSEMYRVLREGSILILELPNIHTYYILFIALSHLSGTTISKFFDITRVKRKLEEIGFVILNISPTLRLPRILYMLVRSDLSLRFTLALELFLFRHLPKETLVRSVIITCKKVAKYA